MSVRMTARVVLLAGQKAAGAVKDVIKAHPVEVLKVLKEAIKKIQSDPQVTTTTSPVIVLIVRSSPPPATATTTIDISNVTAMDAAKVAGAVVAVGAVSYGGYRLVKWLLGGT